MQNTCRHLLPTIIFKDDNAIDFEGFSRKERTISELLDFAKAENLNLHENNVNEILCVDINVPNGESLSDRKCNNLIKLQSDQKNFECSKSENEKVFTYKNLIDVLDKAIKGLEQRNYISDHEIMSVYRIKEKVLRLKPKLQQKTLLEMFA